MIHSITKFVFAVLAATSFSIPSTGVDIKSNFAYWARTNTKIIEGWGLAAAGQKDAPTEIKILPRNEKGFSTLYLKNHPKGNSFLISHTRIPATAGDELILTGEIKGGGKAFFTYCRYDINKRNCGYVKNIPIPLSDEFKSFEIKLKIEDPPKDKTRMINIAFTLEGGSRELYLKNLKLDTKRNTENESLGFRTYPAGRLASTPTMDIEADLKNIWKDIPAGQGFYLLRNSEFEDASRQTSIKMGHDGKRLYLFTRCDEPEIEKLISDPTSYRDGLKADDQVEFAITHDRKAFQRYFVSNSAGAIFQLRSSLNVKASGLKGKDHFYTCLSIPLDGLLPDQKRVEFGKPYYFNVGRSRYAGGAVIHSSYEKGFSDKEKFAIIRFSEKAIDSGYEKEINEPYYSHIKLNIDKIRKETPECLKKLYGEYGTLDNDKITQIMSLVEKSKKTESISEMLEICHQRQDIDSTLKRAVKKVRFTFGRNNEIISFHVNGAPVSPGADGSISCELAEGVNNIAFQSKPGAKINIKLENHPETNGRWRTVRDVENTPGWKNANFNDEKWKIAETDRDGKFVCDGYARQLILWNRTIHGPHRILSLTKGWNISENSIDSMRFANYSPLEFELKGYTIEFSMPSGLKPGKMFTIDETPEINRKYNPNRPPLKISAEDDPSRNGYKKYIFEFEDETATNSGTTYTFLPLELEGVKAESEFNVYYARKGNGNFTELVQIIPFKVLPPVNGRRTKVVKFIDEALTLKNISPEFYEKLFSQHVKCGLNMWKWCSGGSNTAQNATAAQEVARTYQAGAESPASTALYPIWGCDNLGNGALATYILSTPGAKARFFNDKGQWDKLSDEKIKKWKNISKFNRMYCPAFMLTEGRREFITAVKNDFRDYWLNTNPFADGFYLNWENHAWDELIQDDYCFCDRCKKTFRKFASIAENIDLSDDNIKKNYKNEWYKFRTNLDGQILGLVSIAARKLGKHCYIYTQTGQMDYWKGTFDGIDIPSPGLPGNGAPDSRMQQYLDSSMRQLRDNTGVDLIIGQHMVPTWGANTSKGGYLKDSIESKNGFLDPASFKARTVRMIASLHGGFSWWGTYAFNNGIHYYIGEGVRLVHDFEPLFLYGLRDETLVASKDIAYPNLLVLKRNGVPLKNPETNQHIVKNGRIVLGSERLVLLFNESENAQNVEIENLKLSGNSWGKIWERGKYVKNPSKMTLTIPPNDLLALNIIELPEK
ncbi:MAG: hypothetical protein BWY31_00498 [Lentisphaerae bacterium ADurb.Bin242]|nr:MAG: hypothetical protein BWY31_00498 [Lentisphaerae bacterium ADurb.Bin242]